MAEKSKNNCEFVRREEAVRDRPVSPADAIDGLFCPRCGSAFVPDGGEVLVCRRCGHRRNITGELREVRTRVDVKREESTGEVPVIKRWIKVRAGKVDIEKLPDEWTEEIFSTGRDTEEAGG